MNPRARELLKIPQTEDDSENFSHGPSVDRERLSDWLQNKEQILASTPHYTPVSERQHIIEACDGDLLLKYVVRTDRNKNNDYLGGYLIICEDEVQRNALKCSRPMSLSALKSGEDFLKTDPSTLSKFQIDRNYAVSLTLVISGYL